MREQEPGEKQAVLADWLEKVEGWPWREIRWQFALLLTGPLPLAIFLFWRDFWDQHVGFILFDVLIIGGLYILHYRRKFWRENRWIMMPAAFVMLVWVNSIWMQAYWSVEKLQQVKIFPKDTNMSQVLALRAAYPAWVPYDLDGTPSLTIWWDCRAQQCADIEVELTSGSESLQFAVKNDAGLIWEETLRVILPGDGTAMEILLRQPAFPKKLLVPLKAALHPHRDIPWKIGEIEFEGISEAKARQFGLEFARGVSVVVTIITVIFAGLRQLDEQKRNLRRNEVDSLIKRIKDFKYENGKLEALLNDILPEMDDFDAWEQEQRDRFIRDYKELISTKISYSEWWQESLQAKKLFIPSALAVVDEVLPGWNKPSVLIEIQHKLPSYRPARAALYFPPEFFPLEAQFRQLEGNSLPGTDSPERWGVTLWEMRFPPYGDDKNPFLYWHSGEMFRQYPLLDELKFPLIATGHFKPHAYHFMSQWDLRAALYLHCRSFFDFTKDSALLRKSQRTFLAPVLPGDDSLWQAASRPEIYLLRALAGAWLRALAHNPYLADENTPIEQEMLASLLLWRYRNAFAIKNMLLEQAKRNAIPLSPSSGFLQLLEKARPADPVSQQTLAGLLALRPRETEQTLFLCAETALTGISDPAFSVYLRALPAQPDIPDTFLVRFLLKTRRDADPALAIDPDTLNKFLDSRIRLTGSPRQTFDGLFYPPPSQADIKAFIARAGGSPGILVQMARDLLRRHIEQSSGDPDIPPEALLE